MGRSHRSPHPRKLHGFTPVLLGGFLVILWLLLQMQPGIAQSSIDQLRQQQTQIDKQRSQLNQQQDRIQSQERSAQTRLGGIQTRIKATAEQISQNEQKLKSANQNLKKIQADLTKTEVSFQSQQFSTVARLKFLQRQQRLEGWALLLQSQNLNDFLDRRHQLQRVYQHDRQVMQTLKTQAKAIEQKQRAVASQKNQVALLTQELLAQKSEFQAEANAQKANISRLKQDRQALEAAEEQLAKDSEGIASLIQQRIAEEAFRNGVVIQGSGLMGYPCAGPITSTFGNRIHPILGYVRFHSGVDFGVDYGSPILAANAGVVIFAGWYGGYGQTVIIDHGNNTSTLYGHASDLYVTEGQTVQRGQVVASVGSSGLSTGPHLHFEVRVGGEPVDPMPYF
jgi:murein DD-endopeptidase MepM/ murein hydrolase activator NlpD